MAFHLQSLTKAAFGSCTSLGKATRKDKTHKPTSQNARHLVTGEVHGRIPKIRKQLRPLLDAIRAVESNIPIRRDGHGGAGIGPLHIDEQYHRDAWGPCTSGNDWSQCRKIEHAENTVLMYWLKHCFEAVSKNDWEKLARMHYGGPEGLKKQSTRQYWTEIYRWLEQNYLEPPSINGKPKSSTMPVQNMSTCSNRPVLADIGNLLPSKKDSTEKLIMQDSRQLQNIKASNKQAVNNGRKKPHQTAILQTLHEKPSDLKGQCANHTYSGKIDYVHRTFEDRKRRSFSFTSTSSNFEAGQSSSVSSSRRHSSAFSSRHCILKLWKFPRSLQREGAAIVIQSYFRMFVVKSKYKYMKSAVLKIQRHWRWYGKNRTGEILFSDYDIVQKSKSVLSSYRRNQASFVLPEVQDESKTMQDDVDTLQSPEDILYKGNISPSEEERLLTELAGLLSLSSDYSQEGFDLSRSGMSNEEPGEFCFPLLQTDGESEKSTPVLSRIHSPRWKVESCTSVEKENEAFRELVKFLPEWYNIRKLDFMEMEGNDTAFMSLKLNETFPDITDPISRRTQTYKSMSERVLSPANNCDHQCFHCQNFSDCCMEETCSGLREIGLGHSPLKKVHLDAVLEVNSQNCVEETVGEIWARNLSLIERRGKARLLYCQLFGRIGMESKISKLVLDNNPSKGTSLDSRKYFAGEKEIDSANKVSFNGEHISKELAVDKNCFLGLMGKVSSSEVFDHGNSTLLVQYHDPPLLGAVMFPCLFPEASFTSSAIAILCSGLHSKKHKACPESAVQKGFKTKTLAVPIDRLIKSPRELSSSSYARACFECNVFT